MRRVDKSLRDLVALSPFTSVDGNVYVASKTSRVIAVDAVSGTLQHQYSLHTATPHHHTTIKPPRDSSDMPSNTTEPEPQTILVGRTEYTVLCYGRGEGDLRWNITFAEYAQYKRSWETLRDTFYYYTQVFARHFCKSVGGGGVVLQLFVCCSRLCFFVVYCLLLLAVCCYL